ncbi:DUF3159 domain-containing protein [Spiractinospora alimapuensis]|uniref:DUF3159 domain-containing protein n=1 Tax=Spiractinospora alimapuensis TaxID=2820884 RepID=UPI001F3A9E0A|nr:DUF3159 domain-containing protein [Spiractinospora alimapuensis]QVQ52396.1 DUF3159 domain-containing protein [Spiractinospora alimapuensis]
MPEQRRDDDGAERPSVTEGTVEQVIRAQLAKALGGKRGMAEAAVPTVLFTVSYLLLRDRPGVPSLGVLENPALEWAIGLGLVAAGALAVLRLAQRGSPQFVFNSLVGIAIASVFASVSGEAEAAFLPGIIYNSIYAVVLVISILVRWPAVGMIIAGITGDLSSWRANPHVLRLCSRLTWLLVIPCVIRVAIQAPLYAAAGASDAAFAALGTSKIVLGWPLQVAGFAAMVWLLSRNRTPMGDTTGSGDLGAQIR